MTAGSPQISGSVVNRAPRIVAVLIVLVGGAFATVKCLQLGGAAYMPHGACFLWNANLLWSNVIADAVIAASYIAIAAGLIHLVLQNNRQLPFNWIYLAFATFIVTCAGTHVMDIVTIWLPAYALATGVKFIAAIGSAATALAVPLAVLRVTAMLSRAELAEQYRLEATHTKEALNRQTIERALQLAAANADLERALAERMLSYEVLPSRFAGFDDAPRAAMRFDAWPLDAGMALVKPPDESDDLARVEAIIDRARTNAMLKQRSVESDRDPQEAALLEAREEFARHHSQLERRIATFSREDDVAKRETAIAELSRLNGELEGRIAERTIEVERLNATLAKQLRELGRAYDDLESYASALQEHEEQQRTHAQQLRALHAIASATTAQGSDQIEEALRLGLRSLDLDWAFLGTIDHAAGELVIENSLGRAGDLILASGERLPLSETLFGPAVARDSKAVLVVQDASKLEKRPTYAGWSSYIAVPLRIGGMPYGVIGFTSRDRRAEQFSQANVEFLAVAGELISSAVERRLKNEQLASSESRYRALTEAMPQLVWVVDAAGKLEYTNERWSQYTGFTLDEGRSIGAAGFYEHAEAAAIDQHFADPAIANFECEARLRRSDGVYRWHLIRAVPFAGTAVMPGKWIVTATDIEERKLSETLTAAAHSAALAATESKSRFLATMSHEIRTPMNGIVGMTELLLLTPMTEEQREYAQVVRDSGHSLLRVLNDILDYSKIEAGKVDIETVEFDLPGQIESVVELLGVQFRTKAVALVTRLDAGVPETVLGDPGRVRQILLNLAGNALKFTPGGGTVEIGITSAPPVEGKIPIRFTVKDTGIGIKPQVADRLFQPFTQGDASTTRQYGGTGLGLSISAQLVALMGGAIGVDSVPGAGSSFWFEIPFMQQNEPLRKPDQFRNQALQSEPIVERHEKVLVVDDNAVNALLASKQFKRLGFTITLVNSGRRCIEILASEHFDLVFMDCQMPEMDGFATTMEIRRLENGLAAHLPIVAMTADARPEDRERCLASGMDDYLSKPTTLESLKAMIDRWLPAADRRHANRMPPAQDRKPTIGLSMLLDLFEGDRAGVSDVLEAAIRSIRADVVRIERAASTRDHTLLREASHRLKGTSGSIRSVRLVEIGTAIHEAALSQPGNIAPALLIGLREAVRSLDEEIRAYVEQNSTLGAER